MGNRQAMTSWNTWDLNAYSQMTGLSPAQIQQLYVAFEQQSASTGGRMTLPNSKMSMPVLLVCHGVLMLMLNVSFLCLTLMVMVF